MKLLFIDFTLPYLLRDTDYPVGGWAVELNAWIYGLRANGHHVGVLTWKGAKKFVNKNLDFDLIETYDPDKGIKIIKYFYYFIPTLYKEAYNYNPDVIIQACAGLNTGIMAFIAKRLKIPFMHRIAGDIDADFRYKTSLLKYEQLAYKYGLKNTKFVLTQNSYQYNILTDFYPGKQIKNLKNPFLNLSNESYITYHSDKNYIAWVGVFKKPKNLSLLYKIASQCNDLIFKIAGMPGKNIDSETDNALELLKQLSNVEFVGYLNRDEILSFLSNAFVLLNTSHHEGFSNTFLEAFSVGTPVIAPINADPDNIIQEKGLGFAVSSNEDFPSTIKQLCENKKWFHLISQRCQDYVYENHDPQLLAKRLVDIVSEIKRT